VTEAPEGRYATTNDDDGGGFGLCWDRKICPHLWYWQVACDGVHTATPGGGASTAWPWSHGPGEGLAAAVCWGTAPRLGPGQTIRITVHAALWEGRGSVERVTPNGALYRE